MWLRTLANHEGVEITMPGKDGEKVVVKAYVSRSRRGIQIAIDGPPDVIFSPIGADGALIAPRNGV